MVAKQVIFKELLTGDSLYIGGIAIYKDFGHYLELQGVICGECGVWLDAEDVEIISTLDEWWTLDETIKQNLYPDNIRGFRPENQIRMELD